MLSVLCPDNRSTELARCDSLCPEALVCLLWQANGIVDSKRSPIELVLINATHVQNDPVRLDLPLYHWLQLQPERYSSSKIRRQEREERS